MIERLSALPTAAPDDGVISRNMGNGETGGDRQRFHPFADDRRRTSVSAREAAVASEIGRAGNLGALCTYQHYNTEIISQFLVVSRDKATHNDTPVVRLGRRFCNGHGADSRCAGL